MGQGEETFAEILERVAAGRSLAGVYGCAYIDEGGQTVINPPRPLRDINDLPRHDYRLYSG